MNRIRHLLLGPAIVLASAGCLFVPANIGATSAASVEDQTYIDRRDGGATAIAPTYTTVGGLVGSPRTGATLSCSGFLDGQGAYALRFAWRWHTWRLLERAVDQGGEALPTVVVARNQDQAGDAHTGRTVEEVLDVTLTREYLDAHRDSGFQIEFIGERGTSELAYPPHYIRGFLEAVDQAVLNANRSR